jgi:hypothetical protein
VRLAGGIGPEDAHHGIAFLATGVCLEDIPLRSLRLQAEVHLKGIPERVKIAATKGVNHENGGEVKSANKQYFVIYYISIRISTDCGTKCVKNLA